MCNVTISNKNNSPNKLGNFVFFFLTLEDFFSSAATELNDGDNMSSEIQKHVLTAMAVLTVTPSIPTQVSSADLAIQNLMQHRMLRERFSSHQEDGIVPYARIAVV